MENVRIGDSSTTEMRPLLGRCGLPAGDLDAGRTQALAARLGGEVIGCVGLERYGDVALVRSLAVDEGHRRTGIGAALLDAVLARARLIGIGEVFALTTSAADYLERFGFEPTERAALPREIASSSQLRGICPDDATVVRLALDR